MMRGSHGSDTATSRRTRACAFVLTLALSVAGIAIVPAKTASAAPITYDSVCPLAGASLQQFAGDGGPATSAQLFHPRDLVVDASNNIYVADSGNNRVRRIDGATGVITTIAGGGASFPGSGGLATSAQLRAPWGLALGGNLLFIAQRDGAIVSRVNLTTGIITTVAGTGTPGPWDDSLPEPGDGGLATSARLAGPEALAYFATQNR
jgi:DNA-binding beta-propeller fold protein YncE